MNKRIAAGLLGSLLVLTSNVSMAAPHYNEPTEQEMLDAIKSAMVGRGGTLQGDNQVGVDNPIAGMSINIDDFTKNGCSTASYGAGYFCTYTFTSSFNMHSNEGTQAGDRHANAVNTLMNLFMGGSTTRTATATRRFVYGRSDWMASNE